MDTRTTPGRVAPFTRDLGTPHPVLYNNGMEVAGHVAMRFTNAAGVGALVNVTAVCAQGAHLWVAGDETSMLGRLVLDSTTSPTRAGRQRGFRLADLVQLPGPANGEADLKGISCTDGWLWAIGSHALVRRRPKPEHDDEKVVRRLGKLRRDPNRYVIARLAVQLSVDRHPEPVRVSRDGRRSALIGAPGAETLVDLLRSDTHLAPFLAIPGQDNGFEVQGLAAVGDRLYVGLRGPVLRSWAVVLEVRPVQDPTDPGRLALGIFPEGARYRKHFLDLGGLGVRGLCRDGDDLLVLAGPAMSVSGPVRVHRWLGGAAAATGPVVRDGDLPVEAVVPHGEGDDHPAGMSLLAQDPQDPRARLLVVYDGPAADRLPWPDTVLADRVRIGPTPAAGPVAAAGPVGAVAPGPQAVPHPAPTGDDPAPPDGPTPDGLTDDDLADDGLTDDELTDDELTAGVADEFPDDPAPDDPAPDDAGGGRTDQSTGDPADPADRLFDEYTAEVAARPSGEAVPGDDPAPDEPTHGGPTSGGPSAAGPNTEGPTRDDRNAPSAPAGAPDPGRTGGGDERPRVRGTVHPGHLAADLLHMPAAMRSWSNPDR